MPIHDPCMEAESQCIEVEQSQSTPCTATPPRTLALTMPRAFFATRGAIGDYYLESRTVQISSFDALELKGNTIAPISILFTLHPFLKLPLRPFQESLLQLLVSTIIF